MSLLIVGHLTPPNIALLGAAREMGLTARLVPPEDVERQARPDDVVLGRIDVLQTLDGVQAGLEPLRRLEALGVRVLNRAGSLVAAHDKLATSEALYRHGLPHPRTFHVPADGDPPSVDSPVVLKPRFGSWGTDVVRCTSLRQFRRTFAALAKRPWFREHGLLVQELVPSGGTDLRLVVACGEVVGAISRHAAPGEWRTNVALGGRRRRAVPCVQSREVAVAAAASIGADLVGVDLLPTPSGYTVLEVNGCVDFTAEYSLPGGDVFVDAVERLVFPGIAELERLCRSAPETPLRLPT